jgi:L-asparaginase II
MPVRMVEVLRSGVVESIHYGDAVAIRADGQIICSIGDHDRLTFFRSTSKPLQAIYFLESGIATKYGLDLKEVAIISSSHIGESDHIETLKGILGKIGEDKAVLKCGIHEPLSKEASSKIAASGGKLTVLHNNCSGKHIGFIATAKAKNYGIEGYFNENHSVQIGAQNIVTEFANIDPSMIQKGFDGCGVPVIAAPLKNLALAYANLCNNGFKEGKYITSQNYLISAMTMYPEMIGGRGRTDTELMKQFGGRIICKLGDEGVFCVGIIGKAIGIAIKIDDGSMRALGPAVLNLLIKFGIINDTEINGLEKIWKPLLINHKGDVVGEIHPI